MILENPFARSPSELFFGIRLTPLAHFVPIHTVKMRVVVFFVGGFSNLFKDFNFVGGRNLGGGGGSDSSDGKTNVNSIRRSFFICFVF